MPSPHEPQTSQAFPPQLGSVDVADDEVVVVVVVTVVVGDPGSGGQLAGGGAFFWPRNFPGWSFAAVDGGMPLILGGSPHRVWALRPPRVPPSPRPRDARGLRAPGLPSRAGSGARWRA